MSQLKNHPVYDLPLRMRRLRRNPPLRSMLQETRLRPENLIAPLVVKDLIKSPEPVKSMPGVHRLPISGIVEECRKLYDVGIVGVALFPCNPSEIKDPYGSGALDPSGLVPRTIEVIKREISDKGVEYCLTDAGIVEKLGITGERRTAPAVTDDDLTAIAILARRAEKHYGCPQDVEWALDKHLLAGENVVMLQSRPETVWSQKPEASVSSGAYDPMKSIVSTLVSPLHKKP